MIQKLFAVLLVCIWGVCVNGQTSLTITTTSPCVGGTGSFPTGTGVTAVLTCTASTATAASVVAGAAPADASAPDATMVIKQGGTAKFTLSGSDSAVTDKAVADMTNYPTVSADASGANGWAITVTDAPAVMTTGGTWTCEVTAGGDSGVAATAVAAESFSGTAVDLSTSCSGYSMAAVCSGNTISSITLTTTGTDFSAFYGDATAVIVVSKSTTAKYQLSRTTIASATTYTGALDTTGALLAGTYTVSGGTATSWTIAPTTALTDADEGTDWNMIITGTDAVKGGTGAVSLTCGAETNKIAGLFVALMFAMKTFFL